VADILLSSLLRPELLRAYPDFCIMSTVGLISWKEWSKHRSACYFLHAAFLLGLFFDPEKGGNMFLRNIG
jgi:hypothetical protein